MMEVNAKKIAADVMPLADDVVETSNVVDTANVATDVAVDNQMADTGMVDTGMIDIGNDYVGGVDVPGNYGDMAGEIDTPKAGISTQVILYIVIGVCAAIGIALGIVRGIKVAKK